MPNDKDRLRNSIEQIYGCIVEARAELAGLDQYGKDEDATKMIDAMLEALTFTFGVRDQAVPAHGVHPAKTVTHLDRLDALKDVLEELTPDEDAWDDVREDRGEEHAPSMLGRY